MIFANEIEQISIGTVYWMNGKWMDALHTVNPWVEVEIDRRKRQWDIPSTFAGLSFNRDVWMPQAAEQCIKYDGKKWGKNCWYWHCCGVYFACLTIIWSLKYRGRWPPHQWWNKTLLHIYSGVWPMTINFPFIMTSLFVFVMVCFKMYLI